MMLLSALAVPSLGAAITFALAGAWPILPLAGLEMLALGAALYYVNLKMQYRHVITLDEEVVTIDKGFNVPREHWSLQRQAAGMTIVPENHPWESPELAVHDRNCSVSLGEFLGRDDQLRLIELLRGELRVRAYSRRARQPF